MKTIDIQPAIVRAAEDLQHLARKINEQHELGEDHSRRSLEHFRLCGEMLLRAKKECGHGRWLGWLKKNVKFSERHAQRYMELAKSDTVSDLGETWKNITGRDDAVQGADLPADIPEAAEGTADEPSRSVPLVTRNTGNNEWYTPAHYIDDARAVLGEIDLDPASCDIAQRTVRALKYFTKENDGLAQHWTGRVWLNPPYAKGLIDRFVAKLIDHYKAGDVTEAIVLTNDNTDTAWYHSLLSVARMICVVRGRVAFLDKEGEPGDPMRGQTLFYLGDEPDKFVTGFAQYGMFLTAMAKEALEK